MELNLLSKAKSKISFSISGSEIGYINALRRFMISEVPVMAIEDVEFRKNNSILYDEMVAHRLGLVPIKTDLKSYSLPSECKCGGKGCARCSLKFTLKSTKGEGYVYAGQLKSKDPKVVPVYPKMPVVKVLENQEVVLEATAVLGKGKEHMKWSPGLVFYRFFPDISLPKKLENAQEIADRCPQKVFEAKNGELKINSKNHENCTLCNECVELSKNAISIKKEDSVIMFVESWGQLEPKEIVNSAVEIFDQQLDEFAKLIKAVD